MSYIFYQLFGHIPFTKNFLQNFNARRTISNAYIARGIIMGGLVEDGVDNTAAQNTALARREAAVMEAPASAAAATTNAATTAETKPNTNSVDRIAAEVYARQQAEKAKSADPAARKAQLKAQLDTQGGSMPDADRLEYMNLLKAEAAAKENTQSSIGAGYRNVHVAPNGVTHDIYGSDGVAEAQKFYGGPGIPVDANHPALRGQAIPDGVQLVEYRTPARDASLQARIRARMTGAA